MGRAFEVDEANTYVRIHNFDPEFEKVLRSFSFRNLAKWGKVPGDTYGSVKHEITHVFATFSQDRKEYRVIKGFYPRLLNHAKKLGYNVDDIIPNKIPEIVPAPVNYEWFGKELKPRDEDQEEYFEFALRDDKPVVVFNLRTGGGKALRVDTPVLTPNGWIPIGELKVDDEVISRDGTVTKVTGVFPQGIKKLNKVTFWDGRTSYCCDEHLWKIFDAKYSQWKVVDTTELKRLQERKQLRTYIPLADPFDNKEKELPIDPYLLGALIGDGGFSVFNHLSFSNTDKHVVDKVNGKLNEIGLMLKVITGGKPYNYRVVSLNKGEHSGRFEFFKIVNELKFQVLSEDKFIPEIYFEGSMKQRLELLQGLMDTDGTVSEHKTPSYSTSSKELAEGVQKLVWSLGGIGKISSRIPKYVYKGEKKEGLLAYRVSIRMKGNIEIFTLPRQLERIGGKTQYSDNLKLRIKTIEDSTESEAVCISVDHPEKLFVIENFIVTHNTALAIMTFVALGYRVVITVLPRYVPVWTKAFAEFLKMKPGDIINVSDYDINELDGLLKNKTINPKVIIFQLTRIDTYIKRMKELPDSIPHLDDFFTTLGGGVRVIDEAHESIYSVYSSLLYGNMMKTLPLSATLRGDDEFINSVYDATFPPEAYLKPPVYDKYIHVISYLHRLNNQKHRINVKGFGGYSHVQYEKGILKSKGAFENYYQVCKKAFVDYYISTYREGQKAMWFFATIAFCKKFEERLRKDYPDLDIFTFTGEVSKKKGMEQEYNNHQIVITTPGSCSTGKDVAKLYIVFACVCISSMQRNDQMNGRTRPIDKWWPDLDPIFLYFTCLDIPKQLEYDRKRRQVLAKKTKTFSVVDSFLWV